MAFTSSYGKRMLKASMQLQDTTTAKVRRKEIIGSDQYWCQSGLDQDGFSKQFINKYIGFGVFATKHFARGDFLLEYVGEHISLGEANKREKRRKSTRCYMYYYRHKEKTFCVDATKPSDRLCRLVNDERPKKCNAIMKLKIFSNEQYPRLCLYALRDITTGEEITYDYGDQENMEWRKKMMILLIYIKILTMIKQMLSLNP